MRGTAYEAIRPQNALLNMCVTRPHARQIKHTHTNMRTPSAPHLVERRDVFRGISRVERPLDVLERRVHDLVRVREAVHAARAQVDEDVVPVLHAVRVGVGVSASPLEVLPADQARVHVVVRQRYATELPGRENINRESEERRAKREGGGRAWRVGRRLGSPGEAEGRRFK